MDSKKVGVEQERLSFYREENTEEVQRCLEERDKYLRDE